MEDFVQRHASDVIGVLRGFDRLLFRGTLRSIAYSQGFDKFLGAMGVRYKEYGTFCQGLTERLLAHAQRLADRSGRPYQYVANSSASKEQIATEIARRDGLREGLVCVLRCVEPCKSFCIRRDGQGRFRFVSQERKCLHLYFYYLDRDFGLMHVRLATWLPFGIQVCLNGRQYLAEQMRRAGIGFQQRDNCFVRIDDLPRAQGMLSGLDRRKWVGMLNALAKKINPLLWSNSGLGLRAYYGSVRESEYATDVMFRDSAALERVYPHLVDHAIRRFRCRDVLRFLGRRTNSRFAGEVTSDVHERVEGVRVKHWVEENSIKMYDKQGSVLRIETTINNPRRYKVRRSCRRKGIRRPRWIPMRLGVMDLPRRVDVSRAANERYLEALAVVDVPAPVAGLLDPVSRPIVKDSRPYRALRPVSPHDAQVFQAVLSGPFVLNGFTHEDLRRSLGMKAPPDPAAARRQSGRTTRLLRLLRAHGLIRKVSGTRYYRVTPSGHAIMTAALKVRQADVSTIAA